MRIEQITFTRFLAAISIVVFHYGKEVMPFSHESVLFLFDQANIGVSYFFTLSGFVMIIAYGSNPEINFVQYFKNRFARIYPVYFFAVVILLTYYICFSLQIDYSGLFTNLLVIQAWIPGRPLSFNSPGWSLSVEFFFYAIFPFLYNYLYSKRDYTKFIVPIVAIWLATQIAFHFLLSSSFYSGYASKSHDFLYYFPLMHVNEFFVGNLAGLFFIKNMKSVSRNFDLPIIGLLALVVLLLKYPTGYVFHNGLLLVLFIPLIILISANNGFISRISNLKALVFLGEISYGIYILQKPVFRWMEQAFLYFHSENNAFNFYTYMAVLILLSGISYIYIEAPVRKLIKNIRWFESEATQEQMRS